MRKLFFLITLFLFVSSLRSFSQNDTNAYLKGYNETNYFKYFDSLNSLKKATIQHLNHTYKCYVVFKVDTNAIVTDFELIEIPEARLPEIARRYIEDLFTSTNGKWQQQIK